MAQGTRGLAASACLLPNLVMMAAEWAGDKVQGQGARRECFDARDPIPQRGRKPLRKPPNATGEAIEADFCSSLAWPILEGAGQATGPRARRAGSKKPLGVRTGQEELQHYVCMGGGESRMQ